MAVHSVSAAHVPTAQHNSPPPKPAAQNDKTQSAPKADTSDHKVDIKA